MIRIRLDGDANSINYPDTVRVGPFQPDANNPWNTITVGTAGVTVLDASAAVYPSGFIFVARNISTAGQIIYFNTTAATMIVTTNSFPVYPGETFKLYNILGTLAAKASAAGGELRTAIMKS